MPTASQATRFRPARTSASGFGHWVGLIAGFILPLLSALLFRTYHVAMESPVLESFRHLGIVYLLAELAVVLYARRHGLRLGLVFKALPPVMRFSLVVFTPTFWISSVFVSRMIPFSLGLSLAWIIHLLFAASVYHLAASETKIDVHNIARGFVAGLVGLVVIIVLHFSSVLETLSGPATQFEESGGIDLGSAIPGFISNRLFGSWCGAVLALLTGIAWREDNTGERHRLYAVLALAFGLVFWTATRAALLGWVVGLPIAWTLVGKPASSTIYWRLPLYLVAAAGLAFVLPPYDNSQFSFFRSGGLTSSDALASGRLTLWASALHVVADYPLLGSGAGSSWWLVPVGGFYHVQPHNAVVQFLLNWGLIPTIPALLLLAAATWQAHRVAHRQPELLPLILMLDSLLAMSLFDGMLHFAQFVMVIFGCLAICLSQGKRHRMSDDSKSDHASRTYQSST